MFMEDLRAGRTLEMLQHLSELLHVEEMVATVTMGRYDYTRPQSHIDFLEQYEDDDEAEADAKTC